MERTANNASYNPGSTSGLVSGHRSSGSPPYCTDLGRVISTGE